MLLNVYIGNFRSPGRIIQFWLRVTILSLTSAFLPDLEHAVTVLTPRYLLFDIQASRNLDTSYVVIRQIASASCRASESE